ncbi:hypothetical protein M413DRAFT_445593 [Hebeloma cylindrosporum]|uniref:Uncharacterized protein n=1 Tax=Hebeloma cylindrosporum TaxID=76867 RepID=A0A0C2XVH1_HEBCY|nr:hypothetical protein M413DRAFT_445593 [Hebeloma cylindrosporum h7]
MSERRNDFSEAGRMWEFRRICGAFIQNADAVQVASTCTWPVTLTQRGTGLKWCASIWAESI